MVQDKRPDSVYHNNTTVDDTIKNNFYTHKDVASPTRPNLVFTASNEFDSRWDISTDGLMRIPAQSYECIQHTKIDNKEKYP